MAARLGTSLLFFGLFVMMLYVSTERAGWAVLGTLLFAAGAYFGYLNFSHVRRGSAPGWIPSPTSTPTFK